MCLFKTKDQSRPKRVKTVYGGRKKPSKLKVQKHSENKIIKNIKNLSKLQKENKVVEGRIIRDIKTLFEQQEEDYYKLEKVGKLWNYNYTEYESSGDRNINI